jgi:EAL domain-containing protein (putative c-di-GMP-specific phosphodiesterase class I)
MYPADGEDSSTLLRNADIAMYDAKAAGANTFRFFAAQMSSKTLRRTLVEQGLHAAVDKGEIEVHFQPQVRLSDFEVVGFEALARWSHPKLGEVAPMEFISIAEEIGLIHALGEQILYKACRHAAQWPKLGLPPVRVAVNVSPKQLSNPSFPDVISKVLRECGLQPERLELEITESVAIEFASGSADAIQAIAALGVKLAIDDFGAGYSGLSYLKQLPIDTIKIDRTFVRDAPGERDDVVIIRAVIALARSLGVQVCAEGVERSEQVAFLTHAECDYAQGFYFGEAGPAKDISAVVNMLDSANVVPFRKNLKVGT